MDNDGIILKQLHQNLTCILAKGGGGGKKSKLWKSKNFWGHIHTSLNELCLHGKLKWLQRMLLPFQFSYNVNKLK